MQPQFALLPAGGSLHRLEPAMLLPRTMVLRAFSNTFHNTPLLFWNEITRLNNPPTNITLKTHTMPLLSYKEKERKVIDNKMLCILIANAWV